MESSHDDKDVSGQWEVDSDNVQGFTCEIPVSGAPAMKSGACPGVQEKSIGDVEVPQDVPSCYSPLP